MPICAVLRLGLPFAAGPYGSIVSLGCVLVVFMSVLYCWEPGGVPPSFQGEADFDARV